MGNRVFAVAEISGQQVILEPGREVSVPKLDSEKGTTIKIDRVLYYRNDENVEIGTPYIKDLYIDSVIKEHKRFDKIIVFKKKRRKGYSVKKGHRQPYTILEVGEFNKKSAPKKVAKKTTTEEKPKAATAKKAQKGKE